MRKNAKKLEKVAIANALQLEAARRRAQFSRSKLFLWPNSHTPLFLASDKNFDIAIRFSDPDFLLCNTLAIRRRFHAVTLTFDPLTLNSQAPTPWVLRARTPMGKIMWVLSSRNCLGFAIFSR